MATVVTREKPAVEAPRAPKPKAAPVVEAPKVDAGALFRTYQAAQDAVDRARQALETAMVARSTAVFAIKEALGSGPFQWQGQTIAVSSRASKGPDGGVVSTNYFFKGIGGAVQTIE